MLDFGRTSQDVIVRCLILQRRGRKLTVEHSLILERGITLSMPDSLSGVFSIFRTLWNASLRKRYDLLLEIAALFSIEEGDIRLSGRHA